MQLFAVRLIENKQAVGFFWAADLVTLWRMIDSVCDPDLCEYHPIDDRAAITWQGEVKATLGAGNDLDDKTGEMPALDELRRELTFDFALEDYVTRAIPAEWKRVPFADEPDGGLHELSTAADKASPRTARKRPPRKSAPRKTTPRKRKKKSKR